MSIELNKIICGDSLSVLKTFPDDFVDCVITSPPYWNLRDYNVEGQLGLEPTFQEYIQKLCDIFDEVKRVLKKEGTVFVNLGDTYSGNKEGKTDNKVSEYLKKNSQGIHKRATIQEKCLCQIPSRFAIAMCERDSDDIYELQKDFVCATMTCNKTYALQKPRTTKKILSGIREEVEIGASRTISQKDGGMAEEKSRESKSIQQEALLGESGERNNASNEGKCKVSSPTENRSTGEVWRKSSEVCLLWMPDSPFSNDRPYEQRWSKTPERNKTIWLNLSLAQKNELSERFSSFVHELQLGKREIRLLPPRGRQNLSLRKRDIPIELLPVFKLVKQDRWILRNTIVWHKKNAMPSSVIDRFTNKYEQVFFFVKNKKYHFDLDLIRIPFETNEKRPDGVIRNREYKYDSKFNTMQAEKMGSPRARVSRQYNTKKGTKTRQQEEQARAFGITPNPETEYERNPKGKNPGDVWTLTSQPYPEAHFATFPPNLIIPMVKAGCPEKGIILDPFMGSGTVAEVAKYLGRNYLGIELNPSYIKLAENRLRQEMLL